MHRSLERQLVKPYGTRPANELTKDEVRALYSSKLQQGKHALAKQFLSQVNTLYRWGLDEDKVVINPAMGIKSRARTTTRSRFLIDSEIEVLHKNLPASKFTEQQQDLMRFLLLTGCRIGEACGMLWTEVFDKEGIWRQPEAKTKNGHAHTVYLSKQAKALLDKQTKVKGNPYVWTATRTHNKHLRTDGINTNLARSLGNYRECSVNLLEIEHFTPHDLRRTVSTWLAKNKYSVEIRDRMLNHVVTTSIDATYSRHSFDDEAKAAWQAWADHVEGLQHG